MTLPLTLARLEELEALLKGVEPDWRAADYTLEPKGVKGVRSDAMELFVIEPEHPASSFSELIAGAVSNLPQLLAAARCLHGELERLKKFERGITCWEGMPPTPLRQAIERIAAALGVEV